MKKYLKLQAKKSLSLLMAVIMLMTCWVWVAPEKAEAADSPDEGYYYVEVRGKLKDYADSSDVGANDWTIDYSGGTKTLASGDVTNGGKADESGNFVFASGWVQGFPTKVTNYVKLNSNGTDGCGDATYSNGWDVRMPTLWIGSSKSSLTQIGHTNPKSDGGDEGYTVNDSCKDGKSFSTIVIDGEAPKIKEFRGKPSETAVSVTVPDIKSTDGDKNVLKSNFSVKAYDQYGVSIGSVEIGLKSIKDAGLDFESFTKEGNGLWYESGNVKYNKDAQTLMPGKSGTEYYLYAHFKSDGYGEKKELISTITLNYPQYTVKVDQNGSIDNLGATMEMSDGSTRTTAWSDKGYYSASVPTWPKGGMTEDGKYLGASKAGYTFKGFWTTKQPTEGAANYNAYEAEFANPVTTEQFNTYVTAGGVADGNVVTVTNADGTESKYYNAGRQWDATKDKEVLGNATFYGWWISQDVTVKFYDIDGAYLGTQTTKYGKTEAESWYPDPKESYNAGAFNYQTFAKQWRDITGAVIAEGSYTFGPLASLSLTPIYTNRTYSDKYDITFINPTATDNVAKEYEYRDILSGGEIPTYGVPNAIVNDNGYSYEFSGWTTQKPASGKYHTVAKDDTSIVENTDWVVRADTTYYAVYRSTVKEYVIAFSYTDSTGKAKTDVKYIPYGSAISTPSDVNRTYATGGYGYTLEGWDYVNNDSATVMLGVDDSLVFNAANVFLTAENLVGATPEKPIVFTANYDEGQPTPYTVTFKYKDAKGNDKTVSDQVYHGYNITAETVENLSVPEQYDDGTALYTFSGMWKVTEGTADKAEYTKDEFTSFGPTSHVTFEAVYGEGVPFYTVTYIDGTNKYSERILAGSNLPAWLVGEGDDAKEYVPVKEKAETGEYTFAGWFDAEQADKNFAQTNGTKYTTASIVNGDLVLYPQFKFSAFKFTIKFVGFDGKTVLAEGQYEAGESFKDIYDEAVTKTDRVADATYYYTFIGWDNKIPETLLCEGKDMTYTAQYKPGYIYYKAKWYNDLDSMNNADAEMEYVGQNGLLAITNHTYEGAVYAPSVDFEVPEGYVFDGWYYKDGDEEAAYKRGMIITNSMSFYAKYKEAAKVYTVTTVVDGKETEYKIAENDKATVIGRPLDGYVDAEKHSKFEGWFTADDEAFDLDTEINANIKIYAKFTETAHTKDHKELVSAPTYYTKGSEKVWCACSKEDTLATVEIPMLTDTVAPTGTIYLGTLGQWSSEDAVGAAATDNDPVTLYVNGDTDIILTINDTGDVNNAYNPDGKGKGIANIQGIISTGVFGADTTEIAGIQTIFTDDSETQNNTANYVIRLGSYEGLVSGTTYIAYYYARDKADNVLNKNVRTAKFIYDNEAPVITIEGDTNTEKPANILTYCGKATVKDIEEGATVTVNGVEVTADDSKYVISGEGNYIITVTDKAGNTATKKIIVTDGHDEVTTAKAVTCTEDGYTKVICAVCGKTIKTETIESEGHKYDEEVIEATCTEDGYKIKTCSVCGEAETEKTEDKLNHVDTGRYVETTKVATCCVKGEKTTYCQACDAALETEEIALDKENGHAFGTQKYVLKPTCTADGKYYYRCSYCYDTADAKDENGNPLIIEKLNHENTGRYTAVTKTATCYEEGELTTYCKVCDGPMDTSVIAKTSHILKLVTHDADADKSDEYPNGYTQLECQATGCTHSEGKKAIVIEGEDETYTVVFKGMGADGADLELEFDPGETVTEKDVYGEADENGKYNTPEKEATTTEKFTFAGWKGTDGSVVKLPFNVTKNETYTAEFTAAKRIYTHTFKLNANDEDAFATIIGTYNSTDKKPAGVPTKDATATATYKFAGWKDTAGNKVTDFTMTDDATFVADFTTEAIKFNVVYLNEGEHFYSETVDGGNSHTVIAGVPAKDCDDDHHYTFAGWTYGEETYEAGDVITGIASNYRLVAKYTAVEHTLTVDNDATKTWAATCKAEGQKTEICACGLEKVTVLPKTDEHSYVDQTDGSKKCSVCGDTIAAEAKVVTIKFMDGEKVLKEVKVEEGKTYTYTAPEKDATAQYEYKFEKWTSEGVDDVATAEITVTAGATDAVYTAVYTATVRVYNVTYTDADNKVITTSKVEYGETIPAFDADKYDVPEKPYTANEHFTFEKWDHAADTVVTGDTIIRPVYKAEEHNWNDVGEGEATCTQPGGKKQACACGITSTAGGTPALGHNYKIVDEKKADYGVEGYTKKVCERCGDEIVTTTPARDYKTIKVVVKNANGALVEGAKVSLYKDRQFYETQWSNKDGAVEFKNLVHEAEYTVQISYDGIVVDQEVGNGAQDEVKIEEPVQQCSCSCHRPGFWGILFRFFHKVISWLTGKVNCCADPQTI